MPSQRDQAPPNCPVLRSLLRRPTDEAALLLHSGRAHRAYAVRSLLGAPRAWYRYRFGQGGELTWLREADRVEVALGDSLWGDLRTLLNDERLPGYWVGYFSYDVACLVEPGKLDLRARRRGGGWPAVELAWCGELETFEASETVEQGAGAPGGLGGEGLNLRSNFTREEYEAAVGRVLAYIGAGDVFQVNLSQRFTCDLPAFDPLRPEADARELFVRLARVSPAWYGALLELPGGRAVVSTSPELFLKVNGRRVVTRPIKGTRAASVDAKELWESAKDTAELNMIVDLMRNDLGRVCDYGTVRVTQQRTVESHPTVHHAVATIEGRLHESKDVVDLLKATLPGGSVTGAPKVRAMQIIEELEPDPRGVYTGCIGYLSRDEAQLNLAIRTMAVDTAARRVSFNVGGGIVADSEASAEYEETLDKARAMLLALGVGARGAE